MTCYVQPVISLIKNASSVNVERVCLHCKQSNHSLQCRKTGKNNSFMQSRIDLCNMFMLVYQYADLIAQFATSSQTCVSAHPKSSTWGGGLAFVHILLIIIINIHLLQASLMLRLNLLVVGMNPTAQDDITSRRCPAAQRRQAVPKKKSKIWAKRKKTSTWS